MSFMWELCCLNTDQQTTNTKTRSSPEGSNALESFSIIMILGISSEYFFLPGFVAPTFLRS